MSQQNNAQSNNFILKINRLPGVSFSCTRTTTPGISIGNVSVNRGIYEIPFPTGSWEWVPFTAQFIVDEDFTNWLSVFEWIEAMRTAENVALEVSDFSVVVPNNHGFDGISFRYINAFPVTLDAIDLTSNVSSPESITCGLTMLYQEVKIEKS